MHRLFGRNGDCVSDSILKLGNPQHKLWERVIRSVRSVQQMVRYSPHSHSSGPYFSTTLWLTRVSSPSSAPHTALHRSPLPSKYLTCTSTCSLAVKNFSRTLLLGQKSFPWTKLQVTMRCWDPLLPIPQKAVIRLPSNAETAQLGI